MNQPAQVQENIYQRRLDSLADLETFDPKVFVGDEQCPTSVCDFVMALAVIYSDYTDIEMLGQMLNQIPVEKSGTETKSAGMRGGLMIHFGKQRASLIHELIYLLREKQNRAASKHIFFKKLLRKQNNRVQSAWAEIEAVADEKPKASEISKFLLFCRNACGYHKEGKPLRRAFEARFVAGGKTPFICRGSTMEKTKFFFADAAVETFLLTSGDEAVARKALVGNETFYTSVNIALQNLVANFIVARNGKLRKHEPSDRGNKLG